MQDVDAVLVDMLNFVHVDMLNFVRVDDGGAWHKDVSKVSP